MKEKFKERLKKYIEDNDVEFICIMIGVAIIAGILILVPFMIVKLLYWIYG
jgi:hypothetical protein